MLNRLFFCTCFAILLLVNCTSEHDHGIGIPEEPHELLSSYHFFEGEISELNPVAGVLPYDLNTPLFSDYSYKKRFVWMPEGTSARYDTDHVLDFPIGAVLIKNFYYFNDERDHAQGKQLMETRLLINRGEEWDAYGYTWNEDQSDAIYDIVGDIKEVNWINKDGEEKYVDYIIPNKNQCKGCHAYDNKLLPIGPKARNINKDYAYSDGSKNQLEKWASIGYLNGLADSDDRPSVADWQNETQSLHGRTMAYLDMNCGHCHNPKGAGQTSGLTLLATSEIGHKLGVFKPTVSAGAGTGGHTYSVVPGNPDESIMIYRMKSTNPGAMMPELGRRLVHDEGVALVENWIESLDPNLFDQPKDSSLN